MSGYLFALVGAVVTLGFMVELLRRRRLREKYAALWIAVAVVVMIGVLFPSLLERAAVLVGVTLPINLVFFLGLLLLLAVCVQLAVVALVTAAGADALSSRLFGGNGELVPLFVLALAGMAASYVA